MRALSLTSGDLDFTVVDGLKSADQRIRQRIQFWFGEWFLNTRSGIPYLADVFGFERDEDLVERTISDQIRAVPDVEEVRDAEVTLDGAKRTLIYKATVVTRYGLVELDGPLSEPIPFLRDDNEAFGLSFSRGFGA